jgi:hypothetical protein
MKYQNGKIYKIVNDIDKLIYVGSTITSLSQRFSVHKSKSKRYPERKIYKHFAKYGIHHFEIKLIKKYPCNNKLELEIEEERYKIMLNAQLNTIRAHRTVEQLKEYQNEYQNEYRENNRAKINLKHSEYYQKNRAKINLKKNERLFCTICGKSYTRAHKAWHNRSNHHQKCVQFDQSKKATDEKYAKYIQFNNLI